jgi:hypothetical protein
MTPPGIKSATSRLVAQCLNQLRHHVPPPIQWEPSYCRGHLGRSVRVDRSPPTVAKVNQDLFLFSPLGAFKAVYRMPSALPFLPKISIPNRQQIAFIPTAQCLTQICLTHNVAMYSNLFQHVLNKRYDMIFFVTLRPNAGDGLLILDVSRSHTTTQHSR